MYAYCNHQLLLYSEAALPLADLALQRGYAVFDYCRSVNSKPLFLSDHIDRFLASAQAMHLTVPHTREEIKRIIAELIQRNQLAEAGIRLLLTGGEAPDTYRPVTPNFVITALPAKTASAADFEKGTSVLTYEHQRELCHIKSINYLTGVWLQPRLQQEGVEDVIYHSKGQVSELPRANLFVVTAKGVLLTPDKGMLKGITRSKVLALAKKIMPVEVRPVSVAELAAAAEVFSTGTSRRLLPIVKVDRQKIGKGKPGPVTRELYRRFLELENG
jgi:D-alanine transaminase/branched-chain amino acid aminotransferase